MHLSLFEDSTSLIAMTEVRTISRVCLRVRNLGASVAFYRDVLNLEAEQVSTESLRSQRLIPIGAGDHAPFTIQLSEGRPLPGSFGMDHFTLVASSADRIDEIYDRAVARDARATQPRTVDDRRQVFLFDPDGHKIEVTAPLMGNGSARHQ